MTDSDKLRATAFHEAGHAVMAFDLNVPVSKVSIEPEDGSLGHILHGNVKEYTHLDYAITVAGPWAERWVNEDMSLSWRDFENADAILVNLIESGEWPLDEALRKCQSLEDAVTDRLSSLRPKVEAFAALLLERKTVTGAEIEAALR